VIQLQILSGKQAGHDIVVRRFPFGLGREAAAGLPLDEDGVWERHLQISFQRGQGFLFTARGEAPAIINGERMENGMLRNGDLIELGAVKIRFWLARSSQKTMRVREVLTWSALILLFATQVALIYWLLR
jgi:hypothetical protein